MWTFGDPVRHGAVRTAHASATASTSQQIGSAVGLVVLVAIAAPGTRETVGAFVDGLQVVVLVAAFLTVVGALAVPSARKVTATKAEPSLETA